MRGADHAGEITGTGASASLSGGAREGDNKRRTKHVAAPIDRPPDRGSIPLTSNSSMLVHMAGVGMAVHVDAREAVLLQELRDRQDLLRRPAALLPPVAAARLSRPRSMRDPAQRLCRSVAQQALLGVFTIRKLTQFFFA